MILSSSQVEEVLIARHGIERRVAFRGRLEHLRRLGCPAGVNTGKWRPASFGWPQLLELAFALDLMEMGLTPEFTSSTMRANREKLLIGVAHLFDDHVVPAKVSEAAASGKWPLKDTTIIRVNVLALSGLTPEGTQSDPELQLLRGSNIGRWFDEAVDYQAANLFVDVGSKVMGLLVYVALFALRPLEEVAVDLLQWSSDVRSEVAQAFAAPGEA